MCPKFFICRYRIIEFHCRTWTYRVSFFADDEKFSVILNKIKQTRFLEEIVSLVFFPWIPTESTSFLNYARAICLAVIRNATESCLAICIRWNMVCPSLLFLSRLPACRILRLRWLHDGSVSFIFQTSNNHDARPRLHLLLPPRILRSSLTSQSCSSWKSLTKPDSYFSEDLSLFSLLFLLKR